MRAWGSRIMGGLANIWGSALAGWDEKTSKQYRKRRSEEGECE